MTDPIYESLNKIRSLESKEVLNEDATTAAVKTAGIGGKLASKILPGAGLAMGAYDAAKRLKAGDKVGAGIAGATAGLSTVPVVGTAAALLGTGAQAAWDKYKTGSWFPDDDEVAAGAAQGQPQQAAAPQVPPGGDPKVFALQQQLIAKGAKIKADGKMGPATQTAMKQFPDVKMAEDNEENKMSESQKIAELMSRLAQLEQAPAQPQVADEGIADLAKGAWQGIKNFGSNIGSAFKAGVADPAGAKALAPAATKAGEKAALKTGAAVARNPGKVAAAGAAAGAAGMAALGGGAATKPSPTAPAKPAGGAPAAGGATGGAAAANAGPDKADVDALNAMAAELENSQDPVDIELMKRYNGIINAINNRAPGDKRTQGEIAASADLKAAGV